MLTVRVPNSVERSSARVCGLAAVLALAGLLCLKQAVAQEGRAGLRQAVADLEKDPLLRHASWAISIAEAAGGATVVDRNGDLSLEPASLMKILSTGAALGILGPDYRFATRLACSGMIDSSGTLHGNIYIRGEGDPTPGSGRFGASVHPDSIFAHFSGALKAAGIKTIDGDVVADASLFGDNAPMPGWLWEDVGNYYASGAWGINIYENAYRLWFKAGPREGDSVSILGCRPQIQGLTFVNRLKAGKPGSGDQVVIFGSPYTGLRLLTGTVPAGAANFDVDGAIPDPPMLMAVMAADYFRRHGILVNGRAATLWEYALAGITDTASRVELTAFYSPPLSEIIAQTNIRSVNLFAEAVVKACGQKMPRQAAGDAGLRAVTAYWKSRITDTEGLVMADGCGLSRKNKISANQLVQVLSAIRNQSWAPVFYKSLPVSGKSGGMASMLAGSAAEGKVMAKTGNMDGIKSYAGYVTDAGGKVLVFSMIFNNYTCTNAELKSRISEIMLQMVLSK